MPNANPEPQRSPPQDSRLAAWPSVILCIPTCRRPAGLRNLLENVANLVYGGDLSVIVVDNDPQRCEGCLTVANISGCFPRPIECEVGSNRGHTFAYNRAFVLACRSIRKPEYVVVLDDDEFPAPHWLEHMIQAACRFGADTVGGPVFPVYASLRQAVAQLGLRTLIGELRRRAPLKSFDRHGRPVRLSIPHRFGCHQGPSAEYRRGRCMRVRKASMTSAGRRTMRPDSRYRHASHLRRTASAMRVYALQYPGKIRSGPADAPKSRFHMVTSTELTASRISAAPKVNHRHAAPALTEPPGIDLAQ
jgi:glycosyltransferase involved in cell wall biosynthesis